jgi:hypothetical protein
MTCINAIPCSDSEGANHSGNSGLDSILDVTFGYKLDATGTCHVQFPKFVPELKISVCPLAIRARNGAFPSVNGRYARHTAGYEGIFVPIRATFPLPYP